MAANNPKTAPKTTAPAANAAAAPAANAAGEPTAKVKRARPKKDVYPGLKPDDKGKATVKLENWPTDFDAKKHKPLRRADFTSEAPFLEKRADELEAKARQLRKEAADAKVMGNAADRAKAKQLRKMMEHMETLKKQLIEQGHGELVDSMIASLTNDSKTEAAPVTA